MGEDDVHVDPPSGSHSVFLLRAYFGNPKHVCSIKCGPLNEGNNCCEASKQGENSEEGAYCTEELRRHFATKNGAEPGLGLHLENGPFVLNRLVKGGDPWPGYHKTLVLEYCFSTKGAKRPLRSERNKGSLKKATESHNIKPGSCSGMTHCDSDTESYNSMSD